MKYTIIFILALAITSCCKKERTEYKYKITYLDGTTEIIIREDKLRFIGDADCISMCDCTNSERFCGVRKLDLISTRVLEPKEEQEDYGEKTRNDFD